MQEKGVEARTNFSMEVASHRNHRMRIQHTNPPTNVLCARTAVPNISYRGHVIGFADSECGPSRDHMAMLILT